MRRNCEFLRCGFSFGKACAIIWKEKTEKGYMTMSNVAMFGMFGILALILFVVIVVVVIVASVSASASAAIADDDNEE